MKFIVTIECDNDAFNDGNRPYEVADILKNLYKKINQGYSEVYLNDSNGNLCGYATFKHD